MGLGLLGLLRNLTEGSGNSPGLEVYQVLLPSIPVGGVSQFELELEIFKAFASG